MGCLKGPTKGTLAFLRCPDFDTHTRALALAFRRVFTEVLIGDPMQLPPVCVSQMAAHRGLSTSIFDFLLGHSGGWAGLVEGMPGGSDSPYSR